METLYEKSSLILNPGVYDTGKVYCTKPFDGSGDLTFTRNSNATRVNADGLVEKVRTQLLYQTDFSNAYWLNRGFTLNSSTATAPDGTATATKITENNTSTNPGLVVLSAPAYSTATNISVWLKADAPTTINLSTQGASPGASISITTTWQKFSFSQTYSATTGPHIGGFASIAQGSGIVLYVWQPMWEIGDAPTNFIENSTGAPLSVGPTANVPRLNYSNGCPSLLLEPQRTNQTLYSEQFDNGWASSVTIVPNQAVSPDGYQNADLLYSTSSGSGKRVLRSSGVTVSTAYTFSVYAKAAGQNFIYFPDVNNLVNNVWFDLSNGTFSTPSQGTASMIDCGNGWYRCICTTTATTTGGYSYIGISSSSGSTVFNTDGTTGVYVWGAQLEAGSYASSYIPTLGASVTRLADAAYKTGISSLIGQTEGTFFVDIVLKNDIASVNRVISLTESNWLSGGSMRIDIQATNISADFVDSNTSVGSVSANIVMLPNTRYKIAIGYKQNDLVLYMNGTQLGTNTSTGAMPTCSELYLNELGGGFGGPWAATEFNQALLFKTRLTNAQLAELTTL